MPLSPIGAYRVRGRPKGVRLTTTIIPFILPIRLDRIASQGVSWEGSLGTSDMGRRRIGAQERETFESVRPMSM